MITQLKQPSGKFTVPYVKSKERMCMPAGIPINRCTSPTPTNPSTTVNYVSGRTATCSPGLEVHPRIHGRSSMPNVLRLSQAMYLRCFPSADHHHRTTAPPPNTLLHQALSQVIPDSFLAIVCTALSYPCDQHTPSIPPLGEGQVPCSVLGRATSVDRPGGATALRGCRNSSWRRCHRRIDRCYCCLSCPCLQQSLRRCYRPMLH